MLNHLTVSGVLIEREDFTWPERVLLSYLISCELYPNGYFLPIKSAMSLLKIDFSAFEGLREKGILEISKDRRTYEVDFCPVIQAHMVDPETIKRLRQRFEC